MCTSGCNSYQYYLFISNLINTSNKLLIGCALVFASSLAVVFLANTNGYFEHLGLLTALIATRIKGFYKKLLFLAPSFAIALLAHEANFIVFFPVIFMSLLLDVKPGNGFKKLIALGIFSAGAIMLIFFIGNSTIGNGMANKMYRDIKTEIEDVSPIRKDASEIPYSGADKSLALMQRIWANKNFLQNTLNHFLIALPAILTFIGFGA